MVRIDHMTCSRDGQALSMRRAAGISARFPGHPGISPAFRTRSRGLHGAGFSGSLGSGMNKPPSRGLVHFDKAVSGREKHHEYRIDERNLPLPVSSCAIPKAATILRVLLREPGRAWRVAELAAQARASYGHVSNVRKALLAREWVELGKDGVVPRPAGCPAANLA